MSVPREQGSPSWGHRHFALVVFSLMARPAGFVGAPVLLRLFCVNTVCHPPPGPAFQERFFSKRVFVIHLSPHLVY